MPWTGGVGGMDDGERQSSPRFVLDRQGCKRAGRGPGCWLRAGADEAADGLVQDPSPHSRDPPANQLSIPGDWIDSLF
jgi:hypothetical protein